METWVIYTAIYAILNGLFECSRKKAIEKNYIYEVLATFTVIAFLIATVTCKNVFNVSILVVFTVFIKSLSIVIAWIIALYVMRKMSLSLYSVISLSKIIFVTVMSAAFLGEIVTLKTLIGMTIVILGLFLVNRVANTSENKETSLKNVFLLLCSWNSEQFWINTFGQDYASKVLGIVRENCQNSEIDLCWNEFYMTKAGSEKRREDFITAIGNTSDLDVVGIQDNFRPDTSCEHIESSLERVVEACKTSGKKLSITELSCKVGRADIESLNEAMQNGGYSSKVEELNGRIRKVLKTVTDFSERNSDIISSIEARYSDRYDCNHRECEQYGHNIQTSIKRDNIFEQPDILKSEIEATEEYTTISGVKGQAKTINELTINAPNKNKLEI